MPTFIASPSPQNAPSKAIARDTQRKQDKVLSPLYLPFLTNKIFKSDLAQLN